jgi:hypothetical protein
MLKILVQTNADYASEMAWIVLGFLVFDCGYQLMRSWFAGSDFRGPMQFFLLIPVGWRRRHGRGREISDGYYLMTRGHGIPIAN